MSSAISKFGKDQTERPSPFCFIVLIFKVDWASFNVPLVTFAFYQLIKNVRRNPLEFSNNKVKNHSLTQKFPAKSAKLADLAG